MNCPEKNHAHDKRRHQHHKSRFIRFFRFHYLKLTPSLLAFRSHAFILFPLCLCAFDSLLLVSWLSVFDFSSYFALRCSVPRYSMSDILFFIPFTFHFSLYTALTTHASRLTSFPPPYLSVISESISFHPEMPILRDLFVNPRDFLCDILCVCLHAIP